MPPYQTIEEICTGLTRRPETWAKIRDGQNYIPLLPFLEHPYSVVKVQLVDNLASVGLPRAEAERISLRDLVVFALTGPARWGWGAYAVGWIELGFPIDNDLTAALEQLAQDKRFPQRVRHRAFAAARRWRRAHADRNASGEALHHSLAPNREPRLVLLPGLDGTGSLFRGFREALDPSIRTIVVSYPHDRGIDYAGLEGVVRSVLPRRKPFVLLAESFSGPIAISIAASRPAGLRGLIFSCSFARNPRPILAPLQPLVQFLPIRAVPSVLISRSAFGRFTTPALRAELVDALSRVPTSVIKQRIRAVLRADFSSLLAQVGAPVLYLRASEDSLVPRSASCAFSVLPRIHFAEIEGPHFLLQARPSAAASHVQAFFREIEVT
jgi:pimeloyl-ACP methyl ester carboxylesterase